MTAIDKIPTQIVGNIGLYYVCYRLSQMGWVVMPTIKNARGVDIMAMTEDTKTTITIQVKTLGGINNVFIGSSKDKVIGDYWVVVTDALDDGKVMAHVLYPKEVKKMAEGRKTKGKPIYWLPKSAYFGNDDYLDAWERIGPGIPGLWGKVYKAG